MEKPGAPPEGSSNDSEYTKAVLDAMMEELGVGRMNDLSLEDKPKDRRHANSGITAAAPVIRRANAQISKFANQYENQISAWQAYKPDDVDLADLLLDDLGNGQSHRIRMQAELAASSNAGGHSSRGGRGGGRAGHSGGISRGGSHMGKNISDRVDIHPAEHFRTQVRNREGRATVDQIANLLRTSGPVSSIHGRPRGNNSSPRCGSGIIMGKTDGGAIRTVNAVRGTNGNNVSSNQSTHRLPQRQLLSLATPDSFFGARVDDVGNKSQSTTTIRPGDSIRQTANVEPRPSAFVPANHKELSTTDTLERSFMEANVTDRGISVSVTQEEDLISFASVNDPDPIEHEQDRRGSENMEDMWTLKDGEKDVLECIVEGTIKGMTEQANDKLALFMESISKGIVPEGRGIDSSIFASEEPFTKESINQYWQAKGPSFRKGLQSGSIRRILDQAVVEIVKRDGPSISQNLDPVDNPSKSTSKKAFKRARGRSLAQGLKPDTLADGSSAGLANESNTILATEDDVVTSHKVEDDVKPNKSEGALLKYEPSYLLKLRDRAASVNKLAIPEEIRYASSGKVDAPLITSKPSQATDGLAASRWADQPSTSGASVMQGNSTPAATTVAAEVYSPDLRRMSGVADSMWANVPTSKGSPTRPTVNKDLIGRVINPQLTHSMKKERRRSSIHQITEATKRRASLLQAEQAKGMVSDQLVGQVRIVDTPARETVYTSTGIVKESTAEDNNLAVGVKSNNPIAHDVETGSHDLKFDNTPPTEQAAETISIRTDDATGGQQKPVTGGGANLPTLKATRGIMSSRFASDDDDVASSLTPVRQSTDTIPENTPNSNRRLNANSATFRATSSTPRASIIGVFNANVGHSPSTHSNTADQVTPNVYSPQANSASAMVRYVAISPSGQPAIRPPVTLWAMAAIPNPARIGSVKTVEGVLTGLPHEDTSAPGTIVAWVTIPNENVPGRMQNIEAALMAPPYDVHGNRYHSELFPGWCGPAPGGYVTLHHPQPIPLTSQENYHPGGFPSIAAIHDRSPLQQTFRPAVVQPPYGSSGEDYIAAYGAAHVCIAPRTRVTIRSPLSDKPMIFRPDQNQN